MSEESPDQLIGKTTKEAQEITNSKSVIVQGQRF